MLDQSIIDHIAWRNIKPILVVKIPDWLLFSLLQLALLPITFTFKEMNDFWNIINYSFVIPFTITFSRQLLVRLDFAYSDSIKKINASALSELDYTKLKVVKFFNQRAIIYFIILVSFVVQLNYVVVDLGVLSHDSIFFKWNIIYQDSFSPKLMGKNTFFIAYISVQFILLLISIICIVGLIQYTSIFYYSFSVKKHLLANKLPNPPYLGLDKYHTITTSFLKLILIVLMNSMTYLINMRAVFPINLLAFWFLIFIVFVILITMKGILDNYLSHEKENLSSILTTLKEDDIKYMRFSGNLMNVKTQIFDIKSQISTAIGIILSIVSIIIAFVQPNWIGTVREFVEQNIVPWL